MRSHFSQLQEVIMNKLKQINNDIATGLLEIHRQEALVLVTTDEEGFMDLPDYAGINDDGTTITIREVAEETMRIEEEMPDQLEFPFMMEDIYVD